MLKKNMIVFLLVALCSSLLFSATFEKEKTKTADGKSFVFPTDALHTGAAIFAFTMGKDRDNGAVQQMQVIGWQEYFDQNPNIVDSIPVYHFPVLSGVPFFAKGIIQKALFDFYEDKTDPSKVGVLFVSKTEKFANQAGFSADDRGTLVVVAPDGTIVGYVKGEITPAKVKQLQKLLGTL